MGAIGRGCLEILLVWIAAAFGLYSVAHGRFEPPGDVWGAVVGGLLVSFGWGSLRNSVQALSRRRLLKGAKLGMPPRDGRLYAASGTVRALGEPLRSPFSARPCIAYEYEVYAEYVERTGTGSDRTTTTRRDVAMGGFALCPSAVRTRSGDLRILGFPFPKEFPEQLYAVPEVKAKLLEYVGKTTFEQSKELGVRDAFAQVNRLLNEDDGSHRYDYKTPKLDLIIDEVDTMAKEQFIPADTEVCVIGKYSAQKGGLLNDIASGGLEVLAGNVDQGARALLGRAVRNLLLAIFLLALGTGGAYGVLTIREHRDSGIRSQYRERLIKALRTNDANSVEQALSHGASPNGADSDVEHAEAEVRSKEVFDALMRHGYDVNRMPESGYTPLSMAIERKNYDLIGWLLDAGADPNRAQGSWGIRPLERAFDQEDWALFKVLSERGAQGTYVTEKNGSPVAKNGPEMAVIRKFYQAYGGDDLEGVRAVTDNWPEDFFESFSRGLYKGMKTCEPEFVKGVANATTATVTTYCQAAGGQEEWKTTLTKIGSEWKVRREALVHAPWKN